MTIAEVGAARTGLNHQQQQAVDHGAGPLRIMAGAGTGKTKTLTERIISLIVRGLARPEEILALTFTNKAAAEMNAKVRSETRRQLGQESRVTVMTYNAFGYQIVRENAQALGLPADPLLLSDAERAMFLRSLIDELPVDCFDLNRLAGPRGLIRQLLTFFDRWRDEDAAERDHDQLIRLFLDHLADADDDGAPEARAHRERLRREQAQALIASASLYEEKLRQAGAVDFGAQISLAVRLLRERPDVLANYRQRYRWLLVDEYQDTNHLQAVLVRQLAGLAPAADGGPHNVTIVGDPDQSIYAFRGAARDSIIDFPEQFPGAVSIELTLNYRSAQPVLDAANELLAHGSSQLAREPLTVAPGSPVGAIRELPQLWSFKAGADEEAYIAKTISELRKTGRLAPDPGASGALRQVQYRYSDFAVLVRKNGLADGLYEALTRAGIPAYIDRGARLFDCNETRGLMAYLRALVRPEADADLARAMLMPRFGLTEAAIMRIAATRDYGESLFAAVRRAFASEPEGLCGRFANEFLAHHALQYRVDVPSLIGDIAVAHAGSLTDRGQSNFARLQEIAAEWLERAPRLPWATGVAGADADATGQLSAFCDYLEMLDDNDESPEQVNLPAGDDAVQIITAHAAKGLEWPVVFIARCNSRDWAASGRSHGKGYFPPAWGHRGASAPDVAASEEQGEERRLFYVSLTRAKERLYLTWASDEASRKRPLELYALAKEIEGLCSPGDGAPVTSRGVAQTADLTADFCRLHLVRPGPIDLTRLHRDWEAFWVEHGATPPPCAADWFTKWDAERARPGAIGPRTATAGGFLPDLPSVYSYTHLETYEECPARFNLAYVMEAPARPTNSAAFGSAVHRAVASAVARLQAGESISAAAVRSLIAREVAAEAGTTASGRVAKAAAAAAPAPQAADRGTVAGVAAVDATAVDGVVSAFLGASPDGTPVGVELEFYAAIAGTVIHGFIDRLDRLPDGTCRIIDYKTHARLWSEAEAGERLQIPLYILGSRAIGYDAREGELVFLRHGKKIVIRPSDADLDEAVRRVGEIHAAIGRREFPARPGDQCRYCPHSDFCDAGGRQS